MDTLIRVDSKDLIRLLQNEDDRFERDVVNLSDEVLIDENKTIHQKIRMKLKDALEHLNRVDSTNSERNR